MNSEKHSRKSRQSWQLGEEERKQALEERNKAFEDHSKMVETAKGRAEHASQGAEDKPCEGSSDEFGELLQNSSMDVDEGEDEVLALEQMRVKL